MDQRTNGPMEGWMDRLTHPLLELCFKTKKNHDTVFSIVQQQQQIQLLPQILPKQFIASFYSTA